MTRAPALGRQCAYRFKAREHRARVFDHLLAQRGDAELSPVAREFDDGQVLTEGPAIVQYLADLKPDAALAPPGGTWQRVRLQEWLNFITSEIHAGCAPLFNAELVESAKTIFREKLFRRLDVLEATLAQQGFLMGDAFSVADAYLFTVLSWFRFFSIDLNRWPALAEYAKKIGTRPAVRQALRAEATT